ncbi:MAG: ABC transporter ATP-binding protein [Tissierellia bacterium]|nr:ABC transporter ATP-binding protein [Tissierellia bacterium]
MVNALKVENLTVKYFYNEKYNTVINNISFSIYPGEILGIIGESGSGKSTICKALCGLLPKSAKIEGEVTTGGFSADLNEVKSREEIYKRIGLVFQDSFISLNPAKKIIKQFEEIYVHIKKFTRSKCKKEAASLLEKLGFKDNEAILTKYPHELSGGMCQRIAIALVIATSPSVLIADEVTSALDIISI